MSAGDTNSKTLILNADDSFQKGPTMKCNLTYPFSVTTCLVNFNDTHHVIGHITLNNTFVFSLVKIETSEIVEILTLEDSPGYGFKCGLYKGKYIVVAGGLLNQYNSTFKKSTFILDLPNLNWTKGPDCPDGLAENSMVNIENNRLISIGDPLYEFTMEKGWTSLGNIIPDSKDRKIKLKSLYNIVTYSAKAIPKKMADIICNSV